MIMNNVLNDEIIGFSPLMNIDKLIPSRGGFRVQMCFSPLMNIDKLIRRNIAQ